MRAAEQRYLHDQPFHVLVDTLTKALLDGTYTAADVRQALELAERLAWAHEFEQMHTLCPQRPDPSPWRCVCVSCVS